MRPLKIICVLEGYFTYLPLRILLKTCLYDRKSFFNTAFVNYNYIFVLDFITLSGIYIKNGVNPKKTGALKNAL